MAGQADFPYIRDSDDYPLAYSSSVSVSTVNVSPAATQQNGTPDVLAKHPIVGEKSDFPGPILGEEPDFHKDWIKAHYNAKGDGAFLQQYHLVHINGVNDKTFQWGIGALVIKASLDTDTQDIKGQLGIQIPILGYHTIIAFNGNLKRGVLVKLVGDQYASGQLIFTIDGTAPERELSVRLDIESVIGKWNTQHSILKF
ncbi:hypothetical protein JAAARDRAFT_197977 [Jaapia argillacea MUCL 33604]|uniref:Uncharacterized protein n=1 Tax=Jaapia argillacea MUCL 33604 TaxID=933084 RepID=A0A067PRI4_9AGAM|nr:hypothetical protein JAAARDRAFT_197977 [Jaapia argillacea MUCL 33604]